MVLVVLVVLEVPGFEIRILREISSPEPAGNVGEASGTRENVHVSYSKTSNDRTGGANNEYRGLVVLVLVFVIPGAVF